MIEYILTQVGSLIPLLLILWLIFGAFLGLFRAVAGSPARSTGPSGTGTGLAGRVFGGFIFVVLIPVIGFLLRLFWTLYQRVFIVFTEFVSGVHDWPTYRTSSVKIFGALAAIVAFNGWILILLFAGAAYFVGPETVDSAIWYRAGIWLLMVLSAMMFTRLLMQRMP